MPTVETKIIEKPTIMNDPEKEKLIKRLAQVVGKLRMCIKDNEKLKRENENLKFSNKLLLRQLENRVGDDAIRMANRNRAKIAQEEQNQRHSQSKAIKVHDQQKSEDAKRRASRVAFYEEVRKLALELIAVHIASLVVMGSGVAGWINGWWAVVISIALLVVFVGIAGEMVALLSEEV